MRRLGRWLLRIAIGMAVLVFLAVGIVLVGSRVGVVRERLRHEALARLARLTGARVEVGAVSGSLLRTVVFDDVRMVVEGRTVLRVPRVEVGYALLPLLGGELRLTHVVLERPDARAIRHRGKWLLPEPKRRAGGEHRGEMDLSIAIERLVVVDGRLAVALLDAQRVRRFAATRLAVDASARLGPDRQTFDVARVGFVPRGLALSAVEGAFAGAVERGGMVRVSRLEVATARSRIQGRAAVVPGERLEGRVALMPLAAADVRALLQDSRWVGDLRARAHARGPWRGITTLARAEVVSGGKVAARATVDAGARPLAWTTRVRLAGVDPGAAVRGIPAATLNGVVRLRGAGFDPRGPLRYAVALRDSRIEGREIQRLTLAGRASAGVHRLRSAVAAPLGKATVKARVGLDPPERYRVSARTTIARLDLLVPSTWGWVEGAADLRGIGTAPDARRARLAAAMTGGTVHGLPFSRGDLRARLDGSRLDVERLALDSPELRLDAQGRGDVERRAGDLTASGHADLALVGAYLGRPLSGRATLALSGQGTMNDASAQATVSVEQPAYDRVSAGPATVSLQLHGLGGASPGGDARVDVAAVRIGTDQPWALRGTVGWVRHGQNDRADVTAVATGDDGRVQQLAVGIERTSARARGEIRVLTASPPEGAVWRLARPAAFTFDQAITLDSFVLEGGDQRLTLAGRIAVRGGTSDAALTVDTLRLGPLCATADLPPCAGRVSGRLALTGTAAAPVAELSAHATRLRVRDVAYGEIDVTAHAADTRTTLQATLRHPDAGEVKVAGEVPVDFAWGRPRRDLSDAPVALTATAAHLDLTIISALVPRRVESSAGRLSFDLRADGPRRAPRVTGELGLDDGRVQLVTVGIPYERIRARLAADGTRIEVRELHAEAGDGSADVTGTVELPLGGPGAADLTLRLDEFFAVKRNAYEAVVSGALAVRGPLDAPEVNGTLDVDRALVRPAGLPASGPTIVSDPTIEVVGALAPPEEDASALAGSTVADPVRLTLAVTIARNAWIRRNDADIEIAGELQVSKAPGEPVRITGQIRLVRGWYTFKGRRFTLQQGTITFAGAAPPAPTFDITAVHRTGEYVIEVRITGSADKPTLTLSSDPPLEQADILSVLLFGKGAHELGRGQSAALQDQALQLAAGYVVPELRTSVMDALGVDTLEVEMPKGTEQTGKISAGRYVAEDVFLSLAQELGPRAAQELGVEYDVGRNVSVRGSTTTRGTSAIDLFWHYRY